MAESLKKLNVPKVSINKLSVPKVSIGRVALPGDGGPIQRNPAALRMKLRIAEEEARRAQAEADRLGSFGTLAKSTIFGLPSGAGSMMRQGFTHPLRTAGLSGQGAINGLLINTANALSSYAGIPKIPKINLIRPQNPVEEALSKGFEIGGGAGAYYAGTAALRPLLESPKAVAILGKIPGALSTTTRTPMLKPLAQTLIGDQILTQAFMEKGTPWQQRATMAALTPAMTLGFHALGRGKSMAAKRVRELLGDKAGVYTDDELLKLNTQNIKDNDLALKYLDDQRNIDDAIVTNKESGVLDIDATRENISPTSKVFDKMQPVEPNFIDRFVARAKGWISSGRSYVRQFGPEGHVWGRAHDSYYDSVLRDKAAIKETLYKEVQHLSGSQWDKVVAAQKNPILRRQLKDTDMVAFKGWLAINRFMKNVQKIAVKEGWKLYDATGKPLPFPADPKWADTYWPIMRVGSMTKDVKDQYVKQLVKQIQSSDPTIGDARALLMAQDKIKHGPLRRLGNLENPRIEGIPGNVSPMETLDRYIDQFATLKNRVAFFGQEGEKIEKLTDAMVNRGADPAVLQQIERELFGAMDEPNALVSGTLKFQQATKLSNSFIMNATQSGNTAVLTGIKNTLKSLGKILKSPEDRAFMDDFAKMSGAVDQLNVTQETGLRTGKLMDIALYLFKKVEYFNRVISAWSGRLWGIELFDTLRRNPGDAYSLRMLAKAGFGKDEIGRIVASGTVPKDALIRLANHAVKDTQFSMNAMNLPPWSRTDAGKVITQFKSFGFMQMMFARDHIYREMLNGNYAPLIRAVALVPGLYMVAKKGRDYISMRDPSLRSELGLSNYEDKTQEDKDAELFENALNATGTLPGSLLQSASYTMRNAFGEKGKNKGYLTQGAMVAGNVLGPTASDIGNFLKNVEIADDMKREDTYPSNVRPGDQLRDSWPIERQFVNMVPYAGPFLRNTFYRDFPQREREVLRAQLKEMLNQYLDTRDPELLKEINSFILTNTPREYNMIPKIMGELKRERMDQEAQGIYKSIEERKKLFNSLPIMP